MLGCLPASAAAARARQLPIAAMPAGRVLTKSRRFTSAIILITMRWFYILLLTYAAPLAAQSLQIYSEFQRIDPYGRIVPVDRSEYPREILSPELARNAPASFHVAGTLPTSARR